MSRFDLEQDILACWAVVDDLKKVRQRFEEGKLEEGKFLDLLAAIETLYQVKFETAFSTFETLISQNKLG
jgi:hypothetical protein